MVGFEGKKTKKGGGVLQSERRSHSLLRQGMVESQAWQEQSVLEKERVWTEKLGPDFGGG